MINVIVNIFPSAVDLLRKASLNMAPLENGGVLVGTRIFKENYIEYNILGIVAISDYEELSNTYIATSTTFVCNDRKGWTDLILKAVTIYGMCYLGDWHSHPNSNMNVLSTNDIYTLLKQYKLKQFSSFPPLHILVQWENNISEINISANVMIDERNILVIKPQIINNIFSEKFVNK